MTEQDYYAQFVGDEPEAIGYFRASLQWPIVTQDMLDRLNSLMLEYVHVPSELLDAPRLGALAFRQPDEEDEDNCYLNHEWVKQGDRWYCPICKARR